ncbi:hypothetical protein GQR42_00485 [Microcystis aeruginosa FD4]|jgi:hypothetical protein|uniref:Uncharacterized protein n=2 Tax=Microcystis aeruginosa TaxID=1126 RepID=A0A857DAE5_MICAE|nr:hypothetical protein [Microcystis aeruginosa LG13-11]QGZ92601.1 hypothetical protein GQR42_00485 [Microcystis aeruginosa FD4]
MLATETRVQVSILGYLSSDLKEAVGSEAARLLCSPHTPHPTSPLPHFPTSPRPYLPGISPKAYSAIQAKKNETFALRISPDW